MAQTANLTSEEGVGIGVAVALHVLLAGALVWHATREPPSLAPPERIEVSLATDISLESTSPDPSAEPAAAASQPEPVEVMEAQPEVTPAPVERTVERTVTTPPRRTTERTTPAPQPTRTTAPPPERTPRDLSRELDLNGLSQNEGEQGSPGERPSARQQASIDSEIVRQLKPHWNPPSGTEVDRLVTVVRFRLNRDGSLRGNPEIVTTSGVTASNRAQMGRHQEQAVRAVRLAAPFNLPERFYSGWSVVTSNFDNRLAQ